MAREDIHVQLYKQQLTEELQRLIQELKSVGRINPENPADWEAVPPELDIMRADRNESADSIEGYEGNAAILNDLEIRYNEVKDALQRINDGTFGYCKTCNEPIEEKRLQANPAATLCLKHLHEQEGK